jgi:DNA polymerase-3 subunit epsilon
MILVFDTETTGMVNFRMPPDHEGQPNLVQLAAILLDDDGSERASMSVIIKPEGWKIPAGASAIHGITDEIAGRCGVTLRQALTLFHGLYAQAETVVAHNLDFDEAVMATARLRAGSSFAPNPAASYCTMRRATPICKIPHANPRRPDDYKWPKLEECMHHFFGEELVGAHDALVDVRACARVYFALTAPQSMFPVTEALRTDDEAAP